MRQKCFPYRCGSIAHTGVGSDLKRYFDFIFSSVLHNSFKIFESFSGTSSAAAASSSVEGEKDEHSGFSAFCITLAEELFQSTLQ